MNALKKETETKILEAARLEFIEKGYTGSRTQNIADRAGINKALLHYYFRTKDKLFSAVFSKIFKEVIDSVLSIFKKFDSIEESIPEVIRFYDKLVREQPYIPQFIFQEVSRNPALLKNMASIDDFELPIQKELIKEYFPNKPYKKFMHLHFISSILGLVIFPYLSRPLFRHIFFEGDDIKYDHFLDTRVDFVIDLFTKILDKPLDR